MSEDALRTIAEFARDSSVERYPADIVRLVKAALLDALGCLLGAWRTREGKALHGAIARAAGGDATVVGCRTTVSPPIAAFFNATLVNVLDFDDTYASHLSATVVPTCLAVGEAEDVSGRAFMNGLAVGYELTARIGAALRRSAERVHVHGHGTWQCLGASLAAATVLQLDLEETLNAFAIAAANAPVPSVMKTVYGAGGPTLAKNNFGSASLLGVLSVELARHGVDGPRDILTGPTGFWRMIGSDRNDLGFLTDDLWRTFFAARIGFKRFPACRLMQSGLVATLALADGHQVAVEDIRAVEVETITLLSRDPFASRRPLSMTAAEYSLPFTLAVALHGVPPGPGWYTDEMLEDPRVLSLASAVTVTASAHADEVFDGASVDVPTQVSLVTATGRYVSPPYSASAAPKMTAGELERKFHALADPVIGSAAADDLSELISDLESVRSMREVTSWFRAQSTFG